MLPSPIFKNKGEPSTSTSSSPTSQCVTSGGDSGGDARRLPPPFQPHDQTGSSHFLSGNPRHRHQHQQGPRDPLNSAHPHHHPSHPSPHPNSYHQRGRGRGRPGNNRGGRNWRATPSPVPSSNPFPSTSRSNGESCNILCGETNKDVQDQISCDVEGCCFRGEFKQVLDHKTTVHMRLHALGGMNRLSEDQLMSLPVDQHWIPTDTDEDIAKWIEQRRKRFPRSQGPPSVDQEGTPSPLPCTANDAATTSCHSTCDTGSYNTIPTHPVTKVTHPFLKGNNHNVKIGTDDPQPETDLSHRDSSEPSPPNSPIPKKYFKDNEQGEGKEETGKEGQDSGNREFPAQEMGAANVLKETPHLVGGHGTQQEVEGGGEQKDQSSEGWIGIHASQGNQGGEEERTQDDKPNPNIDEVVAGNVTPSGDEGDSNKVLGGEKVGNLRQTPLNNRTGHTNRGGRGGATRGERGRKRKGSNTFGANNKNMDSSSRRRPTLFQVLLKQQEKSQESSNGADARMELVKEVNPVP